MLMLPVNFICINEKMGNTLIYNGFFGPGKQQRLFFVVVVVVCPVSTDKEKGERLNCEI